MVAYVSFINSEPIRNYCRKQQISLDDQSPWSLLRLIVESVHTSWEEKIMALKELKKHPQADTKREDIFEELSLCQVIDLYKSWEERTYNHFYYYDNKSFYEYIATGSNGIRIRCTQHFSGVEKAISNFIDEADFLNNRDVDWCIWIDKITVGTNQNRISVMLRDPIAMYSPVTIQEDNFSIVNKIKELPRIVFPCI